MIVDRGKVAPGSTLRAKYKGSEYVCRVAGTPDGGRLLFVVEGIDDGPFESPSTAGRAVMGGIACNGWRFWSLDGESSEPKKLGRPRVRGTKAEAAKTAAKQPVAKAPKATPKAAPKARASAATSRSAARAPKQGAPHAPHRRGVSAGPTNAVMQPSQK